MDDGSRWQKIHAFVCSVAGLRQSDNERVARTPYSATSSSTVSSSAFSIAPDKLFGEVTEEKRPITTPSRPTRNLVKFHLMLSLPRNPLAFDFKKTYNGCVAWPLTSILENIGNETWYLREQNFWIDASDLDSCDPN